MDRRLENKIRRSRKLLQNPYAYLNSDCGYEAIPRNSESTVHEARRILQNQYAYLDENGGYSEFRKYHPTSSLHPLIGVGELLGGRGKRERYSRQQIEVIVRKLQMNMWRRRAEIWPEEKKRGPLDIIDPSAALESIGYTVQVHESLGQYSGNGELFEVAGILDNSHPQVLISRRFSTEIRNFTMAHELGHAILHAELGMHRDRALDGAPGNRSSNSKEVEADIFAAYFLLPEKQVRIAFEQVFLTQCFILNEATAFALTSESLDSLMNKCRTLRDLTRLLASAEHYNGVNFYSMAKQFRVSIEAMAIRLEELRLVQS